MTKTGVLAAVLFDMDGTLVDSEKLWQVALDDLAADLGGRLSKAARLRMIGMTTPEAMAILHQDIGVTGRSVEADGDLLESRMMTLVRDGLMFRPGAHELLTSVRAAGLKTALVTATVRRIVEVMLDVIGRENFEVVVTHDDVRNGKPHPEPYATAAKVLGVDARDCVAVEDSPTGSASALAAGCAVVAVPSEIDLSHVQGVTHVPSLVEVDVAMLQSLIS